MEAQSAMKWLSHQLFGWGWFLTAVVALGSYVVLPAAAQTSSGEVSGTVLDPSGASIPNGAVVLTGQSTNVSRTAATNSDGHFVFTNVLPGLYSVSVSAAGFKTSTQTGILVSVNQTLSLSYRLSIGSTQQRVEVTGAPPPLQTQTSELGTVIERRAVNDLPLNGRNFTQLLILTPGVTPVQNQQGAGGGTSYLADVTIPGSPVFRPNVNGQWNRSNLYYLDGIFNTTNIYSGYAVLPIVDAVQEFKVQSHNDDAQYGGSIGGIINVVSKSGTDKFHGSAWEYLRNNFFDARDPFADVNRSGPVPFHQNQFGGSIGGPVWIPKLYNGRSRTFFFFAYEGWRYRRATQTLYYVPTSAELAGDFSHSLIKQNIYDPATTTADPQAPSGFSRTQFPGNVIPTDRISPMAAAYFKSYVDQPNYSNPQVPQFNAIEDDPQTDNSNTYQISMNETLGRKDVLNGRYTRFHNRDITPVTRLLNTITNRPRTNTGGDWMHSYSSTVVQDVKFGYSATPIIQNKLFSNGSSAAAAAGLSGLSTYGVPAMTLQAPWSSAGENLVNQQDHIYQTAGSLSILRGNHHFTFGGQWLLQQYATLAYSDQAYQFINDTTSDPNQPGTTGASLASALLGLPTQQGFINQDWTMSFPVWAVYAQDQWRLSNSLTVNLGLRYDKRQPIGNLKGAIYGGFDPNTGNYYIGGGKIPPPCNTAKAAPCIPGTGDLSAITAGSHIMLAPCPTYRCPQNDNFGPRIGFAWSVNPVTVVRGGYGILYDEYAGFIQDMGNHVGNWPDAQTSFNAVNQTLGTPLVFLENMQNISPTPLPAAAPWGTLYWNADPEKLVPISAQWNLQVERQATRNLTMAIAYVGSATHHLDYTGVANTAVTPGPGTAAEVNARRPAPYENSLFFGRGIGVSNYQSLQVSLNHRFAAGLQYLLSYTWSKSIDNGSSGFFAAENGPGGGIQNYYDPNSNRGPSGFNVPQYLTASILWQPPIGHGTAHLNSGVPGWVLGGWQANSIFSIRSGQPFTITVNGDVANIGTPYSYARANLIGNPHLSHPTRAEWFNTAAFAAPSFAFGNSSRGLLYSDHATTFDLSIFRNFPLGERLHGQFRADAFNLFNIINYAPPGHTLNAGGFGVVSASENPPRQLQFALRIEF